MANQNHEIAKDKLKVLQNENSSNQNHNETHKKKLFNSNQGLNIN